MCFGRTGADAGVHAVTSNVGIVYVALQSYFGSCVWCNFLKLKEVDHSFILDLDKDRTRRIIEENFGIAIHYPSKQNRTIKTSNGFYVAKHDSRQCLYSFFFCT